MSPLTDGSVVGYNDDHTNSERSVRHGGFVSVDAQPGHAEDLDVIRWFVTDDEPMRLHGHDGFGGTISAGTFRSGTAQATAINPDGTSTPTVPGTFVDTAIRQSVVAWVEPDGTLMVIQAEGYSPEELAKVADGLVTIDDQQWQQRRAAPVTLPPGCRNEPNGGTSCQFVSPARPPGTFVAPTPPEAPAPPAAPTTTSARG